MIPSCLNKPLSALLVFAFLSIPPSFARNDRGKADPSEQFASLLWSNPLNDSYLDEKVSTSSTQSRRASASSALKRKQNQRKRERLLEKSAREAEKLIKKYKIDVNQKVTLYRNIESFPVAIAAEKGNIPMMKLLIRHKANLDIKQKGFNPVAIAAEKGNIPMMELLIKHGANLDIKQKGLNPVAIAAEKGNVPMMELLIRHGANLNIKQERLNPVAIAAARGNIPMMELLIKHGANLNIEPSWTLWRMSVAFIRHENLHNIERKLNEYEYLFNPVAIAAEKGNIPMVELLIRHGANLNIEQEDLNPVAIAAKTDNIPMMELLIRHGANLNIKQKRLNPVAIAAARGNIPMMELLIKHGANLNIEPSWTLWRMSVAFIRHENLHNIERKLNEYEYLFNPVAIAAEKGNIPMMELLIRHGGSLDRKAGTLGDVEFCRYPCAPVTIAAKTGNIPMMELLIKHGANLDIKMENGMVMPEDYSAVLCAAAESGSIPMVELLLKYIPNTNYQRLGATYVAARKGDLRMLRFLKEQGIPFYSGCLYGITRHCCRHRRQGQRENCNCLDIMRYLLENGVDIKKDRGNSLATACSYEHEKMVRFLLEHGADVHVAGICPFSGSAIVRAGRVGNLNIIKMLLAKGSNIHDTDQDGRRNALHHASECNNVEVIPFLIQQGINVNTPDAYGRTPLILATLHSRTNAVKVLLAEGADASIKDHKGKTAADYALRAATYTGNSEKRDGKEIVVIDGIGCDKIAAKEIYRLLSENRKP